MNEITSRTDLTYHDGLWVCHDASDVERMMWRGVDEFLSVVKVTGDDTDRRDMIIICHIDVPFEPVSMCYVINPLTITKDDLNIKLETSLAGRSLTSTDIEKCIELYTNADHPFYGILASYDTMSDLKVKLIE